MAGRGSKANRGQRSRLRLYGIGPGGRKLEIGRWRVRPGAPGGYAAAPQHFLYFLPLPQGQGSLRPIFGVSRRTVLPGSFTWPV